MAKTIFHPAADRGHVNHGWLNTWHSFSFASWYDPTKIHFGMLRVLNDDTVAGGSGFGKHPHDNMEIITVVMSAGTGLEHSEYNHNHHEAVELFQIWIFPEKRGVTPRYDQRPFDPAQRKDQLQMLVSPISNTDQGLKINQQAWIYRTELSAGKKITLQPHTAGHGFYIFVIEGSAEVSGTKLGRRDAIGIWETDLAEVTAAQSADVLILEVPMALS